MQRPELSTEYSAQGMHHQANPMVPVAIARVKDLLPDAKSVADQGCGRLRHLDVLRQAFPDIVLVDTPVQLRRRTSMNGSGGLTPAEYLAACRLRHHRRIDLVDTDTFARETRALDAVFSVATYDVVPAPVRREMMIAAAMNLKPSGIYVVIVPRNDVTITHRCCNSNAYRDGHVFEHHGIRTYFRNFEDHRPLTRLASAHGFRLVEDLSVYRQVCLLFRQTEPTGNGINGIQLPTNRQQGLELRPRPAG